MHQPNDQKGGGRGPDTLTRSGLNRTTAQPYPSERGNQAPKQVIEADPWAAILAGEADAEDIARVITILDELNRVTPNL